MTTAVRTLAVAGFVLDGVEQNPGYALIRAHRVDEFGASHSYAFALSDGTQLGPNQISAAQAAADHHRSSLVVVGETQSDVPAVRWDRFSNLFGGAVLSTSALNPGFGEELVTLGQNRLPNGMVGRPDDLFEAYVAAGVGFVLAGRVIPYGQERRFEKRPDGVVSQDLRFWGLYDAKAYESGYPVTAESIRQFASYVDDLTNRYRPYIERLHAFIVVSASFQQGTDALADRSRELVAMCGVPLSFLTAATLARMIELFAHNPGARRAINWPRVFADPVVRIDRVEAEIKAVREDRIITAGA